MEPRTIVVGWAIPSQNARDKWHWSRRNRESRTWEILLRAAVKRLPPRPTVRVYVRILSMRTSLIHDDANLRGGAKGLIDALVRLGFLRDDSIAWAHIEYQQRQAPKALRCTRISFLPPPPTEDQ